jgi:hypothetical protein
MGLPKFGGDEVFRRIRAIDPNARVILASGMIEPDVMVEIWAAGSGRCPGYLWADDPVQRRDISGGRASVWKTTQ